MSQLIAMVIPLLNALLIIMWNSLPDSIVLSKSVDIKLINYSFLIIVIIQFNVVMHCLPLVCML